MSDVFKNQKLLIIKVDCLTDLSTGANFKIMYRKPSGQVGSWTATKDGATTKIMVSCDDGKIDQAGVWEFQAYFEEDEAPIFGDLVTQEFKEPITLE
jgi:hypothetical protein